MTSKRSVLFIVDWYEQSTHRAVSEYARQAGWDLFTIGARSFYLPSWWKGGGGDLAVQWIAIRLVAVHFRDRTADAGGGHGESLSKTAGGPGDSG